MDKKTLTFFINNIKKQPESKPTHCYLNSLNNKKKPLRGFFKQAAYYCSKLSAICGCWLA